MGCAPVGDEGKHRPIEPVADEKDKAAVSGLRKLQLLDAHHRVALALVTRMPARLARACRVSPETPIAVT